MYLMYLPLGTGSQWVPLQVLEWGWNGDASRPEGGWANWVPGTAAGSLTGGNATGTATAIHPTWSMTSE